jgi:hypothetical protein
MLEEEGSRPTSPRCLPSWALSKEEEQEQADKQQQQQQEAAPVPKGPTTPLRRAGGCGTFSRAVADLQAAGSGWDSPHSSSASPPKADDSWASYSGGGGGNGGGNNTRGNSGGGWRRGNGGNKGTCPW